MPIDDQTHAELHEKHGRALAALAQSREVIAGQQVEIDNLKAPPNNYGVFLAAHKDGSADIFTSGKRVRAKSNIPLAEVRSGHPVRINEHGVVIDVADFEIRGSVLPIVEVRPDGRAVVSTEADSELLVSLPRHLLDASLRPGDSLLVDTRSHWALERLERATSAELQLEEVPDVTYADVAGLGPVLEEVRNAIELPYLHRDLFKEHRLTPPKGVLLYGPPGCGKTLIAKAVANALSQQTGSPAYFYNIKGPELLNKYVGETERHIRAVFQTARDKAAEGNPVIIFFDEMESMFRERGSGVSSDVEGTIVPQLLSEIDGVEGLENVIVIGATNRQDRIDSAVLRPGRLDRKIKISRPGAVEAAEIFRLYLTDDLPLAAHEDASGLIKLAVSTMYTACEDTKFLEVTYVNGDRQVLYFKDFASGAMIKSVVDRAKEAAIREFLKTGRKGIAAHHIAEAVLTEFSENEDLPNTTNPDDWARISGLKGERIANVRPLLKKKDERETSTVNTGQYL